jgi:serine/threonine protein kinase
MPSTIDEYKCIKQLGKGISAVVQLAQLPDGRKFALKIFDKSNPHNSARAMETLRQEVATYQGLNHPYMVNLVAFKPDAKWVKSDGRQLDVAYMALELISGGELFDYVALKRFSPSVCRYYFKQMLQVMHYMHSNGVTHRDLKPENIMMDEQYNIRFCDFGFAAPTEGRDGSGFLKTILGTTAYMAPELILKEKYRGPEVDLFALAIILFILYTGHPPFNCANPLRDPHYKILADGLVDKFWETHAKSKQPGFFEKEFVDLLTHMLAPNPTSRLSIADVIGHPWMQGQTAT